MQRTKTQFARLAELDRQIRDGRHPNALTFSRAWETSQKTVQRDIVFLRDSLDAPLEYDRMKKDYFYTNKTWFLPAVNMRQSEMEALLLAESAVQQFKGTPLGQELARVIRKLTDAMPGPLPFPPGLIAERFSIVSPPAKPTNPAIWRTLVNAVLTQHSVGISYRSLNTGQTTERTIDPYHIANLHGEWYVFAWCHTKKKLLQFGIPQMQQATQTSSRFDIPGNFAPNKLLAQAFRR